MENRRAKTDAKNSEVIEKQFKNDIQKLQTTENSVKRQLLNIEDDNKQLSIENRKLTGEIESLSSRLENAETELISLRALKDELKEKLAKLENSNTTIQKNRIDHQFEWVEKSFDNRGSTHHIAISVQGSEVNYYNEKKLDWKDPSPNLLSLLFPLIH